MGKLFGVGSGGFWRTGFTGTGGSNFVSNVLAAFQMANASFTSVPGFRFRVLFARAIAKLVSCTVVSLAGDEVDVYKRQAINDGRANPSRIMRLGASALGLFHRRRVQVGPQSHHWVFPFQDKRINRRQLPMHHVHGKAPVDFMLPQYHGRVQVAALGR